MFAYIVTAYQHGVVWSGMGARARAVAGQHVGLGFDLERCGSKYQASTSGNGDVRQWLCAVRTDRYFSLYISVNYLRQGGYVMPGICLFVCLSVSNFR